MHFLCVYFLCVFQAFPFFTAAVILEFFILLLQGKNEHRIFYMFNNITGGFLQQTINKLFVRPIMFIAYCYIYEYFRLYELPWNSVWTWYFTFLAYDFAYYWFHRFGHGKFFFTFVMLSHHFKPFERSLLYQFYTFLYHICCYSKMLHTIYIFSVLEIIYSICTGCVENNAPNV